MRREVCWLMTCECNQNCGYCHKFLHIDYLNYEENEKILLKMIESGITNITWSGGEITLYPHLVKLLKLAKANGVKSKLITNGVELARNNDLREIYNYLDSITFSIDTIDNDINQKMGRGKNHFDNIKTNLDYLKNKNLKININTVVNKMNINSIVDLGNFLDNYKINSWRIFKFMPLREQAIENRNKFEISKEEFRLSKPIFKTFNNIKNVQYREEKDMESKYVLVLPNGDIAQTENGKDVVKGNILKLNVEEIKDIMINSGLRNYNVNKIRTLIAHDDKDITNRLVNAINKLKYVQVVGITNEGEETFNRIVDLKPEMVFAKFDLENLDGLDIIKKSKENLKENIPIFNFISDRSLKYDLREVLEEAGDNMNSVIKEDEDLDFRLRKVFDEYIDFKDKE